MMTRMINIFNINGLPSMTSLECQAYLKEIGQQWTGNGYAMELGSWLGASSIALLEGLVEAGYDRGLGVCLEDGLKRKIQDQMEQLKFAEKGSVIIVHLKEALDATFIRGLTA